MKKGDLKDFEKGGFIVKQDENGYYITDEENIAMTILPETMLVKIEQYEGGVAVKTDIKKYKENENGEIVPDFWIVRTAADLYSGICADHVVVKRYSNYKVEQGLSPMQLNNGNNNSGLVEASSTELGQLSIYPSPSSGKAMISIPYFSDPNSLVSVQVVNSIGEIVYKLDGQTAGGKVEVDMSSHRSGIYFIHAKSGEESAMIRFLKK